MGAFSFRNLRRRAGGQLKLSLWTGGLTAAGAALYAALVADGPFGAAVLAVLLAPGLALPFAFVAGLVQAPLVLLWRSALRRSGLLAHLRLSRNVYLSRDRVWLLRCYAVVSQLGVALCGAMTALWVAVPILERIQDASFKRVLLLIVCVSALAGFGLLVTLASRAFFRMVCGLDAWVKLPWARSARLRNVLLLLPPLLLFGSLLESDAELLGIALVPLVFVEWVLLQVLVSQLWKQKKPFERRWRTIGWGLAVVCSLSPAAALGAAQHTRKALSNSALNGALLSYLRTFTDLDRDGSGSGYGDSDCAPLDPARSGEATDTPGNGIDEDCDGHDLAPRLTGAKDAHAQFPAPVFSGAYPKERQKPYNVLWIVADALRPDHMGIYGYKRNTTPYLSKFKQSLTIFDQAYAQATTTHLSIPSMLTGRSPLDMQWTRGSDKRRVSQSLDETTLAERLSAKGYRTGAVISGHIERLSNMLQGFAEVQRTHAKPGAPHTTHLAQRFLSRQLAGSKEANETPFFLYVYYEDAHAPHSAPQLGEPNFGNTLVDLYDSEISLVDRHIGQLLHTLRYDEDLWKNTLFIVTADHGEEFREHGGKGHGSSCHRETMHVPLIVRLPGVKHGSLKSLVALIDVVPTILEMIGQPHAPAELTGQSLLVPALNVAPGGTRLIPCVATKQGSSKSTPYFRQALRTGNHLFVDHRIAKTQELFELGTDFAEKKDISARPEAAALKEYFNNALKTSEGNLWQYRLR